jgi:hypothetical protein
VALGLFKQHFCLAHAAYALMVCVAFELLQHVLARIADKSHKGLGLFGVFNGVNTLKYTGVFRGFRGALHLGANGYSSPHTQRCRWQTPSLKTTNATLPSPGDVHNFGQ